MSASVFVLSNLLLVLIVIMHLCLPIKLATATAVLSSIYTTSDSPPPLTMQSPNDDAHLDEVHNNADQPDQNNAAHVNGVTPQVEAAAVASCIVGNNFMGDLYFGTDGETFAASLPPVPHFLTSTIIISYRYR